MKNKRYHPMTALLGAAITMMAFTGCGDSGTQPGPNDGNNPNDTARVILTFDISTRGGNVPFEMDSTIASEGGIEFSVSKFLYYVHGISLIDTAGNSVAAEMVDTAKNPVKYNTWLVDYQKPETLTLRVLARRGKYNGLRFALGVPSVDGAGNMLNHVDASTMEYPLNVDADMYWGWKPGYVFLKIEGNARDKGPWLPFYYHIGGDDRLMQMELQSPLNVAGNGSTRRTLEVNVNRLFVTPAGQNSPNMVGELKERIAHSGETIDIVARNATGSGFITLK